MVARVNSAEGGGDGAAVTVGNSAGASGDGWDGVYIPYGSTLTFDDAAAYKGARGYRFQHGSGSATGSNVRWSVGGWGRVRHRFYLRMGPYPSRSSILAGLSDSRNASFLSELIVDPAGRLLVTDRLDRVLWSSPVLPLGSWVRVEWAAEQGGSVRGGYALADGALADSFTAAGADVGWGGFGSLYLGRLSGVWSGTVDVDDVAADDADLASLLGASPPSGTPVVVDPTPPVSVVRPPFPPPDPYPQVVRSSLAWWYSFDAVRGGSPVVGATGLSPTGGTITDTARPGVRRTLSLELAGGADLYELLAPLGTQLVATCHIQYLDQTVLDIPAGVFVIDAAKLSEADGRVSLTAPDKWSYIQRARFIGPAPSTAGIPVTQQLALLIRDAIGPDEPVNLTASSQAVMPAVVWEKDRERAVLDLAEQIGAWVFFDRYGVATVADLPSSGQDSTYWLVDVGDDGVLVDVDREQSRAATYNVVVVTSTASDGEKFPVQYVWDDDPASPTYAGDSVPFASGTPFGVVPYYLDTPVLTSASAARTAGLTLLYRVTGLSSQISLDAAPNPAIDAYDAIGVVTVWGRRPVLAGTAPDGRPVLDYTGTTVLERHIADTVTHPLVPGGVQHIEGRAIPSADLTGGA